MSKNVFQNSNIDMILLKLLEKEEMYGYELIQKIDQISDSKFILKTGTIYPILHELEREGYVTSFEKKTNMGLVRKYYRITEEGKECLKYKIQSWKEYSSIINLVVEG